MTVSTTPATHNRLSTALLRLARILVAVLVAVAALEFVAGLFLFRDYAAAHPASFTLTDAWTPETIAAAVAQLGWPPLAIPYWQLTRDIINFAIYSVLCLVMLARGPRSWFGVFVALCFIATAGFANSYQRAVAESLPALATLNSAVGQAAWQLTFVLFYVFPDGRFVPKWTRWLLIPWIALNLPFVSAFASGAGWWLPVPLVLSTIGSQIYRYFRKSDPIQRAQTKWIVYVVGLLAPLMIAYGVFVPITPDRALAADQLASTLVSTLVWQTVSWAAGLLIPIAFAIAILRYRLWDIDVVIRRTLVYAVVTALLGLVFYGSIILLQRLFTGVTGETSPVAIVASTLVIAALFSPLRRRVQDFVDRRFYRRKYDAQAVLNEFAAVARSETDIERLAAALEGAVGETMQPSSISTWIARQT